MRTHTTRRRLARPSAAFFQPKLQINEPGDRFEQEADTAANKVAAGENAFFSPSPVTQTAQRKEAQPEKEKKEQVMRKAEGGGMTASPAFSGQLAGAKGGGKPMLAPTLSAMNRTFGQDFSGVKLHDGAEAADLNQQIGARAFTHGQDVFFNKNQYRPETADGKYLLAHELAHTVQQKSGTANGLQRKDITTVSSPVPDDFTITEDKKKRFKSATAVVEGVTVTILPDKIGKPKGKAMGETSHDMGWSPPKKERQKDGNYKILAPPKVTLKIQTVYAKKAKPLEGSGYGKGTTASDKSDGNTSLRYHEGSHGTDAIDFLKNNPLPVFDTTNPMTAKEYEAAWKNFRDEMGDYFQKLHGNNLDDVDCVGDKAAFCES